MIGAEGIDDRLDPYGVKYVARQKARGDPRAERWQAFQAAYGAYMVVHAAEMEQRIKDRQTGAILCRLVIGLAAVAAVLVWVSVEVAA